MDHTTARLIAAALDSDGAYDKLRVLCDEIGPRLCGSEGLERAIDWALEALRADGHEQVRAEPVTVPHWVRGRESLTLTAPRVEALPMLGLGGSIATPPGGIEAEVLVATDEASFERLGERVRGRIVLFNNPMSAQGDAGAAYGRAVRFRIRGADMVAARGGVAALVRSVTASSLRTPHTGTMRTSSPPPPIPAAAITCEDADLIARLTAAGHAVRVRLHMEARHEGLAPSANVVAELTGRERPEEVVVISGHLDSWDISPGAHDDGAGCVIAMEALTTMRRLGLRPRRTVRVVLWTNEENGLRGGRQYAADHAEALGRHVAAVEADSGGFDPVALGIQHRDPAHQRALAEHLQGWLPHFAALPVRAVAPGASGADLQPMLPAGVPLLGLVCDTSTYFDLHHSAADTFDKVDPRELARATAAMAALAWLLAEEGLPPGP